MHIVTITGAAPLSSPSLSPSFVAFCLFKKMQFFFCKWSCRYFVLQPVDFNHFLHFWHCAVCALLSRVKCCQTRLRKLGLSVVLELGLQLDIILFVQLIERNYQIDAHIRPHIIYAVIKLDSVLLSTDVMTDESDDRQLHADVCSSGAEAYRVVTMHCDCELGRWPST